MNDTALVIVGGWGSPDLEWNLSPIMEGSVLNGIDPFIFRKCSYGLNDIKHNGANLLQYVRNRKAEYGYKNVYILGHSMGGLICRLAESFDRDSDISGIITIGTPHYGTLQARLGRLFSKSARQMEIGSDFLSYLNMREHKCPILSIACRYDEAVWPLGNAIYRGSHSVKVYNLTHVAPVFSKTVAADVLSWVNETKAPTP